MFISHATDPRFSGLQNWIEKDPKEQKDSPDDAPESGDKLPE
ncbi:hypothetical protein [Erwinia sp. 198]|nr:hypothetical protein [Erwinia sp. 198]